MPTVGRNCQICGIEFEVEQREINRGNGKFCSLKCVGKHNSIRFKAQRPSSNVQCALCGTSFYKPPSKIAASKSGLVFCTRECKDEAQKLGGLKEIQPSHYGAGTGDYSFARTESCQRCEYSTMPAILQVHHIDRDRSNNDPANLICLCPNCHSEEHYSSGTGLFSNNHR